MSEYKAVPILPGFTSIEDEGVRFFLFEGENEALLVDTGFGRGDLKAFLGTLTDKPVTTVVLTHADGDHSGGCTQFENAVFRMHPAEYGFFSADHAALAERMRPAWEGDEICIGEYRLRVVHIPGHTPGSIALLDEKHRFLLGGDTVQSGIVFMFGTGRSMHAFLHSIEKLETMADRFDIVYASHRALEVPADILPEQAQAARDILDGKIPGREPEGPFPCKLYERGRVRFYYQ